MPDMRESEIGATENAATADDARTAASSGEAMRRLKLRDLWRRESLWRGWRGARLFWKTLSGFILSLAGVVTVVLIAGLLTKELTRRALVIEPISVPKSLAENGYAPEVAARRLRDAVNAFVAKAHTSVQGPEIALRGEIPEIIVPTVGLSIESFAAAIRGFLHSSLHRQVTGEFTIADGLLSLRLRLDGKKLSGGLTAGAPDRPDELFASAVPALLKEVQPYIVASYFSKKDPEQALDIAQQTIARLPQEDENVINSYLLKASIYEEKKQYDKATEAVDQALRIDRRSAQAYNSLGNVLYHQDKFDEAIAKYRRAIELDPKLAAAHGNIGNALRASTNTTTKLIEYRKGYRPATANIASPNSNLGIVLFDQGKKGEAIAEYREAIKISNPNGVFPHVNLGNALRDQGQRDEAAAEFQKAIALDPKMRPPNRPRQCLVRSRKGGEAADEFRTAVRLDPKTAEPHNGLGNVLNDQRTARRSRR